MTNATKTTKKANAAAVEKKGTETMKETKKATKAAAKKVEPKKVEKKEEPKAKAPKIADRCQAIRDSLKLGNNIVFENYDNAKSGDNSELADSKIGFALCIATKEN